MAKVKKQFIELSFERVIIVNAFRWIPAYLFEQVKDYDFSMGQLLKLGASVCGDPLTYIYVLTDERRLIKGVLWARVDYVDEIFGVYLLSVDKQYQSGDVIGECLKFMRELRDTERPKLLKGWEINLKNKIRIITDRPAAYEKAGFKKSKRMIMEIDEDVRMDEQAQ